MPILLDNLTSYSRRFNSTTYIFDSIFRRKRAFLCHSHKDAEYITGFAQYLKEENIDVYIDWQDSTMPEKPNRETAEKIQRKIEQADYFFFLATPNAVQSRWCPWEIGYADGVKLYESIFIIPTIDRSGNFYGNEYLQLYQKIDITEQGVLAYSYPNSYNSKNMSTL
ncbi:TPA: toll/interleukin-1 receptor domain-containing protein [Acinetobacter baumannii]|uniref:toll/interleukin-1 receptor domain-containing protein n=1 Tax=Acinetobacter baumannii TaxID=470 RepID=UPI00338F4208